MLNYNRIREHFQECEIERLQKRVSELEEKLKAAQTNKGTNVPPSSASQSERKPATPPVTAGDPTQK